MVACLTSEAFSFVIWRSEGGGVGTGGIGIVILDGEESPANSLWREMSMSKYKNTD